MEMVSSDHDVRRHGNDNVSAERTGATGPATLKDKLELLAVISQIISAGAVVISLIYLAAQITGNTKALKNQGHYNALEMSQRPMQITIENGDIAEIIKIGYDNPEELDRVQWYRFSMYQFLAFDAWEYLYYANKTGSIPKNLWLGANAYYSDLAGKKPGVKRFWKEYNLSFGKPFHEYVDGMVNSPKVKP